MKRYVGPVSMTRQPVALFAVGNDIAMHKGIVEPMSGAHMRPYSAINPLSGDGDCAPTESPPILNADKSKSPAYWRRRAEQRKRRQP